MSIHNDNRYACRMLKVKAYGSMPFNNNSYVSWYSDPPINSATYLGSVSFNHDLLTHLTVVIRVIR